MLNSSCAIGSEVTGQILHVKHVSLVLLEHQPVFLPEKEAAPSTPIPINIANLKIFVFDTLDKC